MSNEQPMNEQEALDFAANLEQSIERKQHPTTITCPLCETSLRRAGHTHKSIVYACLCGATVREVQRPAGQRISIQWNGNPPNSAA